MRTVCRVVAYRRFDLVGEKKLKGRHEFSGGSAQEKKNAAEPVEINCLNHFCRYFIRGCMISQWKTRQAILLIGQMRPGNMEPY